MRLSYIKSPAFLAALLSLLALSRFGAAVEKKDLVGQWQGYYTEDPKSQDKRVKLAFDLWLVKDEIEGVVSLDVILLETVRVAPSGSKLVMEVESMMARGTNSVYNCDITTDAEGVPTIAGTYTGRNGQTIAWLEVKKVPEKGRTALADKTLQGGYKGKVSLSRVTQPQAGEGFDLDLYLTLEGDDVGGKVTIQGPDVTSGKPAKAEYKLEEIRRGLDRVYLKWTDSKNVSGRIMATVTSEGIKGACAAGVFGGGWITLAKK